MKAAILILGLTIIVAFGQPPPQSPNWVAQPTEGEMAEQQRILTRAYLSQQSLEQRKINSQQEEVLKIYAKDPWRKNDGKTNYVGDTGWLQFQGKVQKIEPHGILFRGKFGTVLTIKTEGGEDAESITRTTRENFSGNANLGTSSSAKSTKSPRALTNNYTGNYTGSYSGKARVAGESSSVAVTMYERNKKIIYGDDYFIIVNFPFPTQIGEGFESMMACDEGYLTYTNSSHQVLTVRKLNYGTPCIKQWSPEEIAAAKRQVEVEREILRKAEEDRRNNEIAKQKTALEKAVKNDLALVEIGDPIAMRRMGDRYRDGNGVERDLAKYEEFYKKADRVEEILIRKQQQEQKLREQAEKQQMIDSYTEQSNKGNINAMIRLGKCYRDGDGVEKDLKKAKELFQKAAGTYMVGFENSRLDAAKLISTCE